MRTLHASGIVHRAIRPDHILIGGDGHIILTGFSNATVGDPATSHGTVSPLRSGGSPSQRSVCPGGSIEFIHEWSAPEVILTWDHDATVDSWGFGMVLYFMITGQVGDIPHSLRQALILSFVASISSESW